VPLSVSGKLVDNAWITACSLRKKRNFLDEIGLSPLAIFVNKMLKTEHASD
jgi:hypothetical protein